jgi:hypothetical protein
VQKGTPHKCLTEKNVYKINQHTERINPELAILDGVGRPKPSIVAKDAD